MNFNTYIKSAKQLHNTFITNDCQIKREVYLALCEWFGIEIAVPVIDGGFIETFGNPDHPVSAGLIRASSLENESKELQLADLVDLHDSYVITSDFGTAKQFGDLVGDEISGAESITFNVVACGDSNVLEFYHVSGSSLSGIVKSKTQITTELINTMHEEMVKLKSMNDAYAIELKETKPVSLTDFLKGTEPMNSGKKVTPAPRMKVEYVLVEDSIFDLRDDFESGRLYYSVLCQGKKFSKIDPNTSMSESYLIGNYQAKNLYRRIEKLVDWRNELISFLISPSKDTSPKLEEIGINTSIGSMRENDLLEMCRVALRATGELPDTTK